MNWVYKIQEYFQVNRNQNNKLYRQKLNVNSLIVKSFTVSFKLIEIRGVVIMIELILN